MYQEDSRDILDRMLGEAPADIDTSEGSFMWDAQAPVAEELAKTKIQMDELLKRVFAISAVENGYSEELELRVAEDGLTRKPGTKAMGQVVFEGSDGTAIPEGTVVASESGLEYITLADGIIEDGMAAINIEAVEIGTEYNVVSGSINTLPVQVVGVTSVINLEPITGGTPLETDRDLLARYLFRARTPATSGNAHHYKLWALEVPGVGDAKVIPVWDGPTSVKVALITPDKRAVAESIRQDAEDYIESQRPVGANVTVVSATEVPIDISATLQLASWANINDVKTMIEDGVTEYLKTLAFVDKDKPPYLDPIVRPTRIANVILDLPPVINISLDSLLINGDTANIEMIGDQIAVLGTVDVVAI